MSFKGVVVGVAYLSTQGSDTGPAEQFSSVTSGKSLADFMLSIPGALFTGTPATKHCLQIADVGGAILVEVSR